MRRIAFMVILFISLATPTLGWAHFGKTDVVDVRIVSDNGEAFPKYETFLRGHQEGEYYYLEAGKGQRYSIQITNKSDRRIGIVIAVDGRNIIDGKKSDLLRNERMYIIGPYGTNTFEGLANWHGQDEQILLCRAVRFLCRKSICRCLGHGDHCACCL